MQTEIIQVTPKTAREWLKVNTRNRPVRPSHVERLRASFERGEYVMTHQGIAFCDDGSLGDGQHRLIAIAELPDHYSFPMLVTRGLNHEAAFPVIDVVQAARSVADVLGIDRKIAEVGHFYARLYVGRSSLVTPTFVAPFVDFSRQATEQLLTFCATSSKTWSSAPVRAAAVYNLMRGVDPDYVKLMYRVMVLADFKAMPPVVTALFKSHLNGKVRASGAYDILARCIRAFDPKYSKASKIQINDQASEVAEVRAWLHANLAGQKNAPAEAEAKRVRSRGKFNA